MPNFMPLPFMFWVHIVFVVSRFSLELQAEMKSAVKERKQGDLSMPSCCRKLSFSSYDSSSWPRARVQRQKRRDRQPHMPLPGLKRPHCGHSRSNSQSHLFLHLQSIRSNVITVQGTGWYDSLIGVDTAGTYPRLKSANVFCPPYNCREVLDTDLSAKEGGGQWTTQTNRIHTTPPLVKQGFRTHGSAKDSCTRLPLNSALLADASSKVRIHRYDISYGHEAIKHWGFTAAMDSSLKNPPRQDSAPNRSLQSFAVLEKRVGPPGPLLIPTQGSFSKPW